MAKTVHIDPLTRIEGHLAIRVEVENNRVTDAFSSGEMFRGFEVILRGRHPLDAQQITQRICGVCPISHGVASILAQDAAYGVQPPNNGRLARNLILGANFIQSHIIHFYHLCALDFIDIAAIANYQGKDAVLVSLKDWVTHQLESKALYPAAPFLPRYDAQYVSDAEINISAIKHYLEALDMRALAHQMAALFGGKLPHAATLVPGGVSETIDAVKIAAYRSKLKKVQTFIDECYIPDVLAVASVFPDYFSIGKGIGAYLAYGVFPESSDGAARLFPPGAMIDGKLEEFEAGKIAEDVRSSFFSSPSGLRPSEGATVPAPGKSGAYSWLKAPRYGGRPMEVGPLARILVAYHRGTNTAVKSLVDSVLTRFYSGPEVLNSALGRHAARAIETKIVADRCAEWVEQLKPGAPTYHDFEIPPSATGAGLHEAPRGALGHWLEIRDGRIANYQCVVPTTWNCSPRDDRGARGPVEEALLNTPIADEKNPIEAARVVRSFDPCIACAVH
ncbi:MAG: nickel-dependent hydrogenase large subunit [Candidatus Omnitrophota bacterium]